MTFSCYLMRHAISSHNIQKQHFKSSSKSPNYKQSPQYSTLKYSKSLIDPSILPSQTKIQLSEIDLSKIKLIICSPLKRCLQTCSEIIKTHNGQIKVIVQPFLASRLSSAWSIGSNINCLKKQFPLFDFSPFNGIQSTWMAKFLQKSNQLQELIKSKGNNISQLLLPILQKNGGQNYEAFYLRIKELKKRINCKISQSSIKGNILIVSHSCVLNALVAKKPNEKGKLKGKQGFIHGKPKKYSASDFLLSVDSSPLKAKL